jgi:hypothetical protein
MLMLAGVRSTAQLSGVCTSCECAECAVPGVQSVSPGAAGPRAQMEGMVTDLQLAREKQQAFDDWKGGAEKELAIDLSVTVLTTGFWPTYKARARAAPPRGARAPRAGCACSDKPWDPFAHG